MRASGTEPSDAQCLAVEAGVSSSRKPSGAFSRSALLLLPLLFLLLAELSVPSFLCNTDPVCWVEIVKRPGDPEGLQQEGRPSMD